MKITLNICDDLVRRAKARAALREQSLSRYVEESLERSLKDDEESASSVADWIDSLPSLSKRASKDLNSALGTNNFRNMDAGMWK